MTIITYQPAQPDQSEVIAGYIIMAGGEFFDFLLANFVPGLTPKQIVAEQVAAEAGEFSYRYIEVALDGGQVVGIVNSYPAQELKLSPEMAASLPRDRLEILREFMTTCVEDSWYLSILAVAPNYRQQGIGGQFIDLVKQKAKNQGFSSLSLTTWADNRQAIRLYQQHEFQIIQHRQIALHPLLPDHGGFLLLECRL
ncbi:MAG: GNAT family N-acetyltransferase [Aphanocapsa sp. GSE-SYN-MK-11-07L]|jgi:ribosomal protein S18 acetylase RimI-like enzyme|nr:GNAT family N-acetyltransferase [Aphanocapsa sp. GSE-SYN-MK-11-07L]